MIEKKEKIFLILVAVYVIVAECLYTFCDQLICTIELLIGGLIVLVMFMKSKKLYIGIREILALATMLSWGVIMHQYLFAVHGVAVWFIYLYITNFLMNEGINRDIVEKVMWCIALTLIIGFATHGLIDTAIFFSNFDWNTGSYYVCKDGNIDIIFWEDYFCEMSIPRTIMTAFLIPIFACFLPVCVAKGRYAYKFVVIALISFLLAGIWRSAFGRTPFCVFFAIVLLQAVVWGLSEFKNGKLRDKKKRIFIVVAFLIIVILVTCLVVLKNDTMADKLFSIVYRDGGIFGNIRFQWQIEVLKNILKYPFGVYPHTPQEVYGINYSHNVWTDIALFAGVIPFLTFTLYTAYTILDIVRFSKKSANMMLKMIVSGMYLGYMLFYFVEPAFNASIEFIVPWLMINAMVCSYIRKEYTKNQQFLS